MKKLIIISIIILIFLAQTFFVFPAQAFNYVINDFSFYAASNAQRPAKGVPYIDPVFHTTITRITDGPIDLPGTQYDYVQPGYNKHDIENLDGTMLIIQSRQGSGRHIWNANPPYNKLRDLDPAIVGYAAAIDFRWSRTDADVGYYIYQGRMWRFKYSIPGSAAYTMIHDFRTDFTDPAFAHVTMQEEGTPSDDGRYWAFGIYYAGTINKLVGMCVFDKDYYDLDNGKVISSVFFGEPNYFPLNTSYRGGSFSMSPSGKYVIVTDLNAKWPRDFSAPGTNLNIGSGHSDLGYSKEGREVMFGFKINLAGNAYYAAMVDLETNARTMLYGPIGVPKYHFSTNNYATPGWGLISTYNSYSQYQPNYPDMWGDSEVYMVEMTTRTNPPPKVWRVANVMIYAGGSTYGADSFGKINRNGTKIWFGSNWGSNYTVKGQGQYDVYQIDLPATWYEDLKVISSDTTPPAAPTGVMVS